MSSTTAPRLSVGHLLVQLLFHFRAEMLDAAVASGFDDLRQPHLHVLGSMRARGMRLTDLADRSQLSMGTTSVFVSELEDLGYLRRRPDPDDGRAKRIDLTPKGKKLMVAASGPLSELEARWSKLVGGDNYEQALSVLQALLDRISEASEQDPEKPDTSARSARTA